MNVGWCEGSGPVADGLDRAEGVGNTELVTSSEREEEANGDEFEW